MIWFAVSLVAFIALHPLISLGVIHWRTGLEEFVTADRQVSPIRAAMSLLATMLGASAILGTSGLAMKHGWSAMAWPLAGVAGLLLLSALVRRLNLATALTLPDLLGQTGGRELRWAAGAVIVPAWVGIVAAQLAGAGKVAAAFHPDLFGPVVVATGVAVALYVVGAGQKGVIRTDVWQLVAIFGLLAAVLWGTAKLSTSATGVAASTGTAAVSLPWSGWLEILVAAGFTYLVGPDIYSRLITVRHQQHQRRLLWIAAAGLAVAGAAVVGSGVAAASLGLASPAESVLVAVPRMAWGEWGALLVSLGILAALMSSADTCLLSAASILSLDILNRRDPNWIRAMAGVLAAVAVVLALWLGSIIETLLLSYTLYTGGLMIPAVFALFIRRPLHRVVCLATMVTGGAGALTLKLCGVAHSLPIALAASLMTALVGLAVERAVKRPRARP